MIAPGVVIFGVLPVIFGASDERMRLLWLGAVVGAVLLVVVVRWPRLAIVLPLILAVELSANVIVGRSFEGVYRTGMEVKREWWPLEPVKRTTLDLVDFEEGGAIARRVTSEDRGRIVTLVPGPRNSDRSSRGRRRHRATTRPSSSGTGHSSGTSIASRSSTVIPLWTSPRSRCRIFLPSVGSRKPVKNRWPACSLPLLRRAPTTFSPSRTQLRGGLVANVEVVEDEMASLRAIGQPDFDSERTVVLEDGALGLD